jgi:hypothetical protein
MSTQHKQQRREAAKRPDGAGGSVHPEKGQRVAKSGVPDDKSSKASTSTQQDARTPHDRDGNAEQSRKAAGDRHG